MIHEDADYVMITLDYYDDSLVEVIVELRYSKYTINRLKLCYDIKPRMIMSFDVHHVRTEVNINPYILDCFRVNDYYLITFEWLHKIINDEHIKFNIDEKMLAVIDIAKKNVDSINKVKQYHKNRLEEMMDDIDYVL